MALIGAEGLSGFSIGRIAERVGIVPSAVYRHYESKEAVQDAVLDLLRSRLLTNVAGVCAETPNALERLRLLFERHMKMLVDNPAFPHVIFAHFSQHDDGDRWSSLHTTMCAYLTEVEEIIEQGKGDGLIRADIPSRTAAVMFVGLVLPAAMLHRLSDGEFDTAAHVESAWPAYVRALTVPGKRVSTHEIRH